jgi:death-on-curing protein
MGLLESALARPRNRYAYAKASMAQLAASYAIGVSRDHPFIDGNKRTSLVVAELFLALNDIALTALPKDCVVAFVELAAGAVSEDDLAEWLERHSRLEGA